MQALIDLGFWAMLCPATQNADPVSQIRASL